jgi:hypothetical protein
MDIGIVLSGMEFGKCSYYSVLWEDASHDSEKAKKPINEI